MGSTLNVFAASPFFPEGYESIKDFSAYWIKGNEYAVENKSSFPITQNYFASDAPFNAFITQIDDYVQIKVAPGETVLIQPRIYFTKYDSNGTVTAVGDRFVKARFGYWNIDSTFTIERSFSSRDSTGGYLFDFVFSNTGTKVIYFDTFEFGCFDSLPSGYSRYYMQVNYIRYDVMPTAIYNQYVQDDQTGALTDAIDSSAEKIEGAIENSTDTLVNGWNPQPQKPSGSGTVESTNDLEHQISQNAQAGIDQSNSLFGSFGDTMSILTSGMIFVTGLFNTMLSKMQFLESLAIIGLVLGIIGFILNLVPSIGSRLSRSDRDRERKEKERVRAEKEREKRVERKNYNNIGNRTRRR